jgi:glyoxylase-like metal-dependent hydrolase (beta-lactamase superfamily II)
VGSTRFILPQASNEEIQKLPWLIPHFATDEGRLKMSIHSLAVETPSRRIVVDTCLGNDKQGRKVPTWNNLDRPFLEDMTVAGFPPDSIDTVLCTHLHVDHVGWNTKLLGGRWLPTFPNARYIFGKIEYEHWRDHSTSRGAASTAMAPPSNSSFSRPATQPVEFRRALFHEASKQQKRSRE